jgi:hypothetical protein
LIYGGFYAPLGVVEVDETVPDDALQLRCVSGKDIDLLDLRFLLVTPLDDEEHHVIILDIYSIGRVSILVLEHDPFAVSAS